MDTPVAPEAWEGMESGVHILWPYQSMIVSIGCNKSTLGSCPARAIPHNSCICGNESHTKAHPLECLWLF